MTEAALAAHAIVNVFIETAEEPDIDLRQAALPVSAARQTHMSMLMSTEDAAVFQQFVRDYDELHELAWHLAHGWAVDVLRLLHTSGWSTEKIVEHRRKWLAEITAEVYSEESHDEED